MPTAIERSDLEQGHRLPKGLTCALVAERRGRWGIARISAPVPIAPGSLGWGVPHIRGVPLEHPSRAGVR
jgi:hypothetical protein